MKLRWKILLTIGAALTYSYLLFGCPANRTTSDSLTYDYKEFNEDYFLGQLPRDTEVVYGNLTQLNDMGYTWKDDAGRFHITVDKETNPVERQARMTLLHEACHVEVETHKLNRDPFDAHGIEFQNCMVNLAEHGAFRDLW